MEEEEQGGNVHENNIMGEVVSRTLQYTQIDAKEESLLLLLILHGGSSQKWKGTFPTLMPICCKLERMTTTIWKKKQHKIVGQAMLDISIITADP
jgi:hypothetical protein